MKLMKLLEEYTTINTRKDEIDKLFNIHLKDRRHSSGILASVSFTIMEKGHLQMTIGPKTATLDKISGKKLVEWLEESGYLEYVTQPELPKND